MPPRVTADGLNDIDALLKDGYEEQIAAQMAAELEAQYQDLLDELDTDTPQNPDDEWWGKWAAVFLALLIPLFGQMAEDGALSEQDRFGVGVDVDAVLSEAGNWASTYGFNLVSDLNTVTQRHLQRALTEFYSTPGGGDLGLLTSKIERWFTPVRAQSIAITETTRGFERGKEIYRDGLRALGIETDRLWHTMQDERVCEICAPNDEVFQSQGWTVEGLPAHPNDRCWTTIEAV